MRYILFLQEVDEFDITILAEIALQLFLVEDLKVLDIADVDVPRRSGMDGESKGRRQGTSVLSPTDLQAAIVEGQTLVGCHLEEGVGRSGINECHELGRDGIRQQYRNMIWK